MTDNKTTKFSKKYIIIAVSIFTVILVSIIIGVIIHNNSQNSEAEFDSKQIYREYTEINEEALDIEKKYATDGFIQPEDISTVLDELEVLAKEYKSKGLISSYDKQSTSIYFKLNSGVGYLYTPTVEELLAGDDVGKILTIEPYATSSEFVSNYLIGGKSPDKAAENIVEKLPHNYTFSKEDNWDSFSFEQVEQLGKHKIIIWYGHGGYVKEYGSVLGTSIPIKDQSSLLLYQLELSNGEMILGKDCFCISPSYFEKHIEDNSLEGSLVFLGACQSAMDNRLAEVFINKGASLVVGNSHTIRIRYMLYMMDDFMSALTNQYDDGTYWTAEDALAYAKSQNGEQDSEFWAYGAEVKLIYPESKSGYRLYGYDDNNSKTQETTDNNTNKPNTPKIENTYLQYDDFSEGLAWVKYSNFNGNFWGCINKSGEMVFELFADDIIKVFPFSNGYAYIEQNDCYKTIDSTGETVATYQIDEDNTVLAYGDGYVLSKKHQADFDSSEYIISVHNIDGSVIDSFSDEHIKYNSFNYCGKGVFELSYRSSVSDDYDEVIFFSVNSKDWIDYKKDNTNCYCSRNMKFYDDLMLVGMIYTDDNYSFEYMDAKGNFTSVKFGNWDTDFGYIWRKEPGPINKGLLTFNCGSDEYVGLFLFDFSTKTMKKMPEAYRDKVIKDELPEPLIFENGYMALPLKGSDGYRYLAVFDTNWKLAFDPIQIGDNDFYPLTGDRLIVRTDSHTVVYDTTGKIVFTPSDIGYTGITPYADGVARVENKTVPTYLDTSGNLLFNEIDMSNIMD